MSVMPVSKVDKISFCENHISTWTTNATAIGTTTTAVTDLNTKTTAARAAFNAQQLAQDNAKSATEAFNLAVTAMAGAASGIIQQVRTKAMTAGDSVYTLANIPAPATPTPVGPPGTPSNFKVSLDGAGGIILTWKCDNPVGSSGTLYQVWRRTSDTAEFDYIGGAGSRSFTDDSIPAGSSTVTYKVQAVRSTAVGLWAQFIVQFGMSTSGTMTASVVETTPSKIAA